MTRDIDSLRTLLREGRSAAAWAAIGALSSTADLEAERALARLLRFDPAEDVETDLVAIDPATLSPTARSRWHMARGICCNRARDPLGALAWLNTGLAEARKVGNVQAQGELLLEVARVHLWMGSFARAHEDLAEASALSIDQPVQRMQVFHRYADMYAEAERWPQALRFAGRALALAPSLKGSVHVWQLLECATRIHLALRQPEEAQANLKRLAADASDLPDYLRFRLEVLRTRLGLLTGDSALTDTALASVQALAAQSSTDSFQQALAQGLVGEVALARGDAKAASEALSDAAAWHETRDLAVPRIRLSLLLADAFVQSGRNDEAARLLTQLRDYCARRGLQLQREAVDLAQQRHDLPRMADIESGRPAQKNAWSNSRAYVILEQLGRGGQGSVHKAHDTARDRLVAFKRLNASEIVFTSLAREVEALCRARIHGVAQVLACGTAEDGIPYIVQELVPGPSLRNTIIAAESDRSTLVKKLLAVASALDQLHAQQIAHGDIKPENVIDAPGRGLVLVDFGAASLARRTKNLAGTRAYLPSGIKARFITPAATDQYAFGLILLEALTGRGPEQWTGWPGASSAARPHADCIASIAKLPGLNRTEARLMLRRLLLSWPTALRQTPKPLAPQVQSLLG